MWRTGWNLTSHVSHHFSSRKYVSKSKTRPHQNHIIPCSFLLNEASSCRSVSTNTYSFILSLTSQPQKYNWHLNGAGGGTGRLARLEIGPVIPQCNKKALKQTPYELIESELEDMFFPKVNNSWQLDLFLQFTVSASVPDSACAFSLYMSSTEFSICTAQGSPTVHRSPPAPVPTSGCTPAHSRDLSSQHLLPRVPRPHCWKQEANAEGGVNGAWVCIEVCHVDIIACERVYQLLPWPGVRLCLQRSIRKILITYLFLGKRHWNKMTPKQPTNLKTAE